jgi:hypothetical protein
VIDLLERPAVVSVATEDFERAGLLDDLYALRDWFADPARWVRGAGCVLNDGTHILSTTLVRCLSGFPDLDAVNLIFNHLDMYQDKGEIIQKRGLTVERTCLLGGIAYVTYRADYVVDALFKTLYSSQIPLDAKVGLLIEFNDRYVRTHAEVLDLIDRTIARLRA